MGSGDGEEPRASLGWGYPPGHLKRDRKDRGSERSMAKTEKSVGINISLEMGPLRVLRLG